jgi:ABC-type transport system substrate-binding protein
LVLAGLTISSVTAATLAEPAPADEGVAVTIYSSADPASFDPHRFIAQQRQGYDPQFAWQVPGFGVVKEVRKVKYTGLTGTVEFDGKGDPKKALYFVIQVVSADPAKWGDNKEAKRLEIAAPAMKKK